MTIERLWQEYSKVLPEGASRVQCRETRLAFYAGIFSLLQEMKRMGDEMSEDEGCHYLEQVDRELMDFYRGMHGADN